MENSTDYGWGWLTMPETMEGSEEQEKEHKLWREFNKTAKANKANELPGTILNALWRAKVIPTIRNLKEFVESGESLKARGIGVKSDAVIREWLGMPARVTTKDKKRECVEGLREVLEFARINQIAEEMIVDGEDDFHKWGESIETLKQAIELLEGKR